jgi:hypothetical protein
MIIFYQITKPSQCRKESRIYGLSWVKKTITKHSFREISSILKKNFRSINYLVVTPSGLEPVNLAIGLCQTRLFWVNKPLIILDIDYTVSTGMCTAS